MADAFSLGQRGDRQFTFSQQMTQGGRLRARQAVTAARFTHEGPDSDPKSVGRRFHLVGIHVAELYSHAVRFRCTALLYKKFLFERNSSDDLRPVRGRIPGAGVLRAKR